MRPFLLDVNVLLALFHKPHVAHRRAQRWFLGIAGRDWATCPFTQAGFVRISCNPRFSEHPIDISDALQMLTLIQEIAGHQFWPVELGLAEAIVPFRQRLFGHRQMTDAYLLGLALNRDAQLVTLDESIVSLAGSEFAERVLVL